MEERNAVIQLLEGLIAQADSLQVYYQKKFWTLGEKDFPVQGAIRFMRDQLTALEVEAKKNATSDPS